MVLETIFSSNFGEKRWVHQISQDLVEEITKIPISIFNVPNTLQNPDSYIPKAIALGPYHHFEPHLYQMERYKLAALKSFLNPNQILDFQHLVIDKLKQNDSIIRASYHKYIDFDDSTLAWVFAVDGFFLLRILSNYDVTWTNRKLTHQSLLCRDALLLENQVPFVVLNQLREMVNLSSPKDEKELVSMLFRFCKEHSPLPITSTQPESNLHLLDVMYHLIVDGTANNISEVRHESVTSVVEKKANIGEFVENLEEILEMGAKVFHPLQVVENLPWQKIFNLLGIKRYDQSANNNQPVNAEIAIPAVSYLNKIGGIKFSPANGGISEIKFVEKCVTFYLPVLSLNANSEAILRNLVAYEAATAESTRELAEYIGLMSAIIDTAEDADLLTQNGIITGSLTGDEILNMFNGMNEISGRNGSNTIDDINAYLSKRPKVKICNIVKKQIYGSRKFLIVFTTILLILLLIMQSFCDVYGCKEFWGRN